MRQILTLGLLLSLSCAQLFSQKATVHGYIKDHESGEVLISATVLIKGTTKGTVSNVYGFYSLSLDPGNYTLVYSYIGYESVEKTITLNGDLKISLELEADTKNIAEVIVSSEAKNSNILTPKMGIERIDSKTIEKLPVLLGEADVIKTLQLMPGVVATSEMSSNLSIRGGARDQNLILLDDATVYNASHLLGLFSVFNNDAINNVELYKGIMPAKYGGSISSAIDVRMNEGNNRKFSGVGSIGLLSSKLTLETPIVYNKGAVLISGRRTYMDLLTKASSALSGSDMELPYYFYDLNAKANFEINEKNRVFVSGYFGRDVFDFELNSGTSQAMSWGNYTGTARWNYVINNRLFMNTMVLASQYDYSIANKIILEDDSEIAYKWVAGINDYSAKVELGYFLNPSNTLSLGVNSIYHKFDIADLDGYQISTAMNDTTEFNFKVPKMYCWEHSLYLRNEQKLGGHINLDYGVHFSLLQNVGPGTIYELEDYQVIGEEKVNDGVYNSYYNIDPRFSVSVKINEKQSIKAGYARTHQYLHIASNSNVGTPLDVWMPVTKNIEPQYAHQGSLGYFRNFLDNSVNLSVEGYYKRMYNQIEFKEFSQPWFNEQIEEEFRFGEGRSYGLELMVKRNTGKLTGWVAYTLAKAERKIEDIWQKGWYASPYDQRHNLAIVGMYDITQRWSVSANWVYNTGKPFDAPVARWDYGNSTLPYYQEKNKSRYPAYHRLDLSLTFKIKPRKLWEGAWVASVYNVYNRKNANVIYFEDMGNYTTTASRFAFMQLIPSVAFNFNF